MPPLVIRGRRVVTEHSVAPASIHVSQGCISGISKYDDIPEECDLIEASPESVVMPGLVDTHVHVNEPGRTDWEGFETATRAAAAGGVTTLIDMPLNSIPATTTLDGFNEKIAAASGKLNVDVGIWGGVVPGNTGELEKLWRAGVVGFKCFLIPSGVDEFPNVTESDLRAAMPELARLGAPLIIHAEVPGPIEACCQSLGQTSSRAYQTFLDSRPRQAENDAVFQMIMLARDTGCAIHIVHHSSADAVPMLRRAKYFGLPLTVETCPHYLHFAAEDIPDGATEFKCCPPIRERENREQLWEGLREGTIDFIVSDHSPCPPEMKLREQGDFMNAWGGISSLQLRLPIVWTEASRRGFTLEHLVKWLCSAPARQIGFHVLKGSIRNGADAAIVIWNPEAEFRVVPEMIQHRHKLTPYLGETLCGVVEKTILGGQIVYDNGAVFGPYGSILLNK